MKETYIWFQNQEGIQIIFDMDGWLHMWMWEMEAGGETQILIDDT